MSHLRRACIPILALLFAGTASPSSAAQKAVPTDVQLKSGIERKIAGLKLGSSKITVNVFDHVVTLDGNVQTLWLKRQAIDLARKTDGVQRVDSTLEVARGENDTQVAAAVSRELQQYPLMSVYDYVDGVVRDGGVTLTGAVTNPIKSSDLTERIEKLRGVRDITNNITVLPVSPQDDQIRVTIANEIYSDSLFDHYSLSSPPIHVIVENGRVTLVGIVSSDIERQKAIALARMAPGVFSVDNKIRLASELPR